MEVLLIDMGALAMFLAYMAIVYWLGAGAAEAPALTARHRSGRSPMR